MRHAVRDVLGRDLQLTAHVIFAKFLEEIIMSQHQVIEADARAHEDLLHARQGPELPQQLDVVAVVRHEVAAGNRRQAWLAAAGAALQLSVAGRAPEVRRGPAHIVDIALEARHLREDFRLAQDGAVAAALDDAPFMRDNRAEVAAAKTAAMAHEAELHLADGRHAAVLFVDRMVGAHIGQVVDGVHARLIEGHGWLVLHHAPLVVLLGEPPPADGVLLQIFQLKRGRELFFARLHCLIRRQCLVVPNIVEIRHTVAGALHVLDVLHGHALLQIRRDLDDGPLPHAEDKQIRHAVHEDGAAHLIRPVIVVRETAQAGLDAAEDDGYVRIELPQAVAIDDGRPLRATARAPARRISIIVAHLARRRILIQHRVHIAGRNKKPQPGLTQTIEVPG